MSIRRVGGAIKKGRGAKIALREEISNKIRGAKSWREKELIRLRAIKLI